MITGRYKILIAASIAVIAVIAAIAVAAALSHHGGGTIEGSDGSDKGPSETFDDTEADFSQYNVLKQILQKLDDRGGAIVDSDDRHFNVPVAYNVSIYMDTVFVCAPDQSTTYIFDVHDIRTIVIN